MKQENVDHCNGMCPGCPFNYYSEVAVQAQNWGCLPEPSDIMEITKKTRMHWSCHEKDGKLCAGYAQHVMEKGEKLDKEWPMFSTAAYLREGVTIAASRYKDDLF